MILYYSDTTKYIINPNIIEFNDVYAEYENTDACCFIVTNEGKFYGEFGKKKQDWLTDTKQTWTTHEEMCDRYGLDGATDIRQEGRLWKNKNAIAFWGDKINNIFSFHFPSSQELGYIKECFMKRFKLDISNFNLYRLIKDNDASIAMVITVNEYISYGFTGNETFDDYHYMYLRQEALKGDSKKSPENLTKNSMDKRDFWRHYEVVGENKIKITKTDIKHMVTETIKRILES